jgi:hypothetical protein
LYFWGYCKTRGWLKNVGCVIWLAFPWFLLLSKVCELNQIFPNGYPALKNAS